MKPPPDIQSESQLDAMAAALLRELPEPPTGAEARVGRRLARSRALPEPRRTAPSPWLIGGLTVALAAASAAMVLRARTDDGTAPNAIGRLDSETVWAGRRLDGVDLTYRGAGEVAGSEVAPRINWQRGTLNVEVMPGRGLDVRVQTREAEVRVVGTGFTVKRDALGTSVEVRHGVVETSCVGEAPVALHQGDQVTCLPSSPAGLLGRAQALQESGAEVALVAASLDRGLALTSLGDPIGAELGAMKVEVLAASGQGSAALESAHALLKAGGSARADEVIRLAAGLAAEQGGCATAAAWLLDLGPTALEACGQPPAIEPAGR